jgi:hypothetical protein
MYYSPWMFMLQLKWSPLPYVNGKEWVATNKKKTYKLLINYLKFSLEFVNYYFITNFFWPSLSKFFPTYPFCTFLQGMNDLLIAANYQISVIISLISPISVHSILWLIYMQVWLNIESYCFLQSAFQIWRKHKLFLAQSEQILSNLSILYFPTRHKWFINMILTTTLEAIFFLNFLFKKVFVFLSKIY